MSPKSARTLMWASVILLIVGSAAGNPAGLLTFMSLAALCALAPVVVGPTGPRVVGAIVLLLAAAVGVASYSAARRHMDAYRHRAAPPAAENGVQAPAPPR